jgi:UDPglucose 6-dehydrogenase
MGNAGTRKKIAIVGTGYVGMACAIGFAEFGHTVVGYDILPERVRLLQSAITPYREVGIAQTLAKHIAEGHTSFVDDLALAVEGADFVVIAVGTPSLENGKADLRAVYDVVRHLGHLDLRGATVVLRSTVPPGTSDRVADMLRGKAELAYAPEFLREGSAVSDFLNPDRVVVGSNSRETCARYFELFSHLSCPMLEMSLLDAELCKAASNAFLAMKISFANQIANLCDELDADALHVLRAVGHDRRIGRLFLHPGIGFGGPCFEKDIKSLIHVMDAAETSASLFEATLAINDSQPGRILDVLRQEMGHDLGGLRIGVWGLTFKGGTSDLRDSLALRVVDDIVAAGARVIAFDPSYTEVTTGLRFELTDNALAAAEADVLVVLTDWPQFATVDAAALAKRLRKRLVVDGRNLLDADALMDAGLRYRGIGRRRSASLGLAETG